MNGWKCVPGGLWNNMEKWGNLSGTLKWDSDWLKNGFCEKCRLCCGAQAPDDPPFPMPLLPGQISDSTPDDFYLLDAATPFIGPSGCKSASCSGCKLPHEKKPVACGLFPLVLANGKLFLYQNCPAALFTPLADFMAFAKQAGEALARRSLEDLKRLSINLSCDVLAEKYIDMHVRLFEKDKKTLLLE